ncbi:MAG TPA: P-type conjugative transfer protein TrbL [Candidatus Mailhella merdavium]|nr:P-type conjugative transfer protein TrbL [Candidatus Mailhella merdavium]
MTKHTRPQIIFFITFSLCFLVCIKAAFADGDDTVSQTINIIGTFQDAVANWDTILKTYTLRLFALLLMIDIAWIGIRFALERPQLTDLIKQVTVTIFFAAVFIAAINNYKEWTWQIVSQFQEVAKQLTPEFVEESSPLKIGFLLCLKIMTHMSILSPIDSFVYSLSALIILICFALLSAQIIFIKCEATISMAASMILLGFGGAGFTKDYAVNAIRYVIAVAFKLFIITLLLGVGANILNAINLNDSPTFEELFVIIGAVVVLLSLATSLPDVCAGIINGSHVSSGMALVSTAGSVASIAIGGMLAGVGAVGAAKTAGVLASEEGKSGLGKALHIGRSLTKAGIQTAIDMPGHRALKTMSNMNAQLAQSRMNRESQGEGK